MENLDIINVVILIGAGLIVLAALTSLLSFRLGVPLLLVFLCLGLLAGEDGIGGIDFDNAPIAFFVGSIALAVILFDAGFETPWRSYRLAAAPGVLMATLGVVMTASLVALPAHWLLGIGWTTSFLLGAIVSSTDAAAVFLLLRIGGVTIRERLRSTLEIESGSNDPIAVFLTLGLAELAMNPEGEALVALLPEFVLQLGAGAGGGWLGGLGIVWLINRVKLEEGLYPLVVIGLALAVFAALNAVGASGFLGVYVAGLVAGNRKIYSGPAIRRFQVGLTWLAQIGMFLTLGLLATPSSFGAVAWQALAIGAVLILIARPLAAWLCLLPFRFDRREMAYVGWVGLRGAVSILLAIVPLMAGHPNGQTLFNVAFIIVLLSLLVQGTSIRPMAKLLGQMVPPRQGPADRVELALPGEKQVEMVAYTVRPESPVARGQHLPRWARPALILRDGHEIDRHATEPLRPGDHLYLFATPDKVPMLDKLFAGQVELSPEDREFFGDFSVNAETTLDRLAEEYGQPVSAELGNRTLAMHFAHVFGEVEIGDRLRVGGLELVVVVQEAGIAKQLGLILDPHEPKTEFLFLPTGAEMKRWSKRRWNRWRAGLTTRRQAKREARAKAREDKRKAALPPPAPSASSTEAPETPAEVPADGPLGPEKRESGTKT